MIAYAEHILNFKHMPSIYLTSSSYILFSIIVFEVILKIILRDYYLYPLVRKVTRTIHLKMLRVLTIGPPSENRVRALLARVQDF